MKLSLRPTQWAATLELTPSEVGSYTPTVLEGMLLQEAVQEAARNGHTPQPGGRFWLVPDGDAWLAIAVVPIVQGQS